MKSIFIAVAAIIILTPLSIHSATVGDIDNDGQINLTEAIYALQVAAGQYPNADSSCQLEGKGDWSTATANYLECDVVKESGFYYICTSDHSPSSSFASDSANWTQLALQAAWNKNVSDIYFNGNVGIGISSPATTLDIAGSIKLAKYSAAPTTCNAAQDGTLATTSLYTMCICNGTEWVATTDGQTACIWIDPNDIDNDSDGFTENQGDCADDNGSVYPGAAEICGDGIDQDCSGSDLKCQGDVCTTGSDCATGNCVDGVCCDTTCSSTCVSCVGADTGIANGTCGNITTYTDPGNECANTSCNGVGACFSGCTDGVRNYTETDTDCGGNICDARCETGQTCDTGSDCQSGSCVSILGECL